MIAFGCFSRAVIALILFNFKQLIQRSGFVGLRGVTLRLIGLLRLRLRLGLRC